MPIETGIPSSLARPQVFHRFTYLKGGGQLVPLAQKVALLGAKLDTGTAVAAAVYDILSSEQGDILFGEGSEVALMIRQAFRTQRLLGRGPRIVAVGVADPEGGVNATFTLTVTGPADESGNVVLKACGRRFKIGVSAEETASDVASAIVDVVSRSAAELPFTVEAAAGVITATANNANENGNDIVLEVESVPAGIAIVVAPDDAGAGALDLGDAYDAIEGIDIDGFAISNRTTDDIEDILDHVTAMWQPAEKKWRWGFVGDTETLSTATALAEAANDRAIIVGSVEASPSMPFEVAAALAVGAMSRERPNANYDGMKLPIYPPALASAYSGTEVEAGIAAGLTVLTPIERGRVVVGDQCKVERMVTTKTVDDDDNPFLVCRDLAVPRTGAFMARQLDIAYGQRFGQDANPDGVLMDDDADDRVRDMIAALWHDAAAAKILTNVDADLAELIVEPDEEAPGRFNVDAPETVVIGLHQIAYNHRVKVGG